jgi:hypothetical protein
MTPALLRSAPCLASPQALNEGFNLHNILDVLGKRRPATWKVEKKDEISLDMVARGKNVGLTALHQRAVELSRVD